MDTDSGISWYYQRKSDVLFVDEDTKRVGIDNSNPSYELDVLGAINAVTYCNLPTFALSNNIYPLITSTTITSQYASNQIPIVSSIAVYGSNTSTWASNNLISTSNQITLSNLNLLQTLKFNNSNIIETDGKIDYTKWLKNAPSYTSNNTLGVAGIVLGATGILSSLGSSILKGDGKLGDTLFDDLTEKMGNDATDDSYDPDTTDSNLKLHWNAILHPPIYQNKGSKEIGFGSNIYIENNSKIFGINKLELLEYDNGRYKRITTNPSTDKVFYDFSNETLYCKTIINEDDIYGSNVYIKYIDTSNITSSNINASQVKIGNYYQNSTGLYVGNPNNPFTSYQVLDENGNYKLSIQSSQVTGWEAIDTNKLKDGVLSWNGLNTSTTIDPFNSVSNPLYVV